MNYKELIEQGVNWDQFLGVIDDVDSSMIDAIGMDGLDLFIQFSNGDWYKAESAGIEYGPFTLADSVGKYYHSVIKKNYSIYKINSDGEEKAV